MREPLHRGILCFQLMECGQRLLVFALLQKPPRLIKLRTTRLRWIGLGQVDGSRRLLCERDLGEGHWSHKQQKNPTNKFWHGKIRNRYPEKIRTRSHPQG